MVHEYIVLLNKIETGQNCTGPFLANIPPSPSPQSSIPTPVLRYTDGGAECEVLTGVFYVTSKTPIDGQNMA